MLRCTFYNHSSVHFLAGLTPKSSWDIAQVDVVIDTALDLNTAMNILFEEPDQEKKV